MRSTPFVRLVLSSLLLIGAATARAEGGIPTFVEARRASHVDLGARSVDPVRVARGAQLVFENPGWEIARVELDLPRGEGISCAAPGELPVRGRKFLVSGGRPLTCDAPPVSLGYRVFRGPEAGARAQARISSGRIVVTEDGAR